MGACLRIAFSILSMGSYAEMAGHKIVMPWVKLGPTYETLIINLLADHQYKSSVLSFISIGSTLVSSYGGTHAANHAY